MKEWFKARNVWGASILELSDAEAGRLAKAVWAYTMTGEAPNLSGNEKAVFALIRYQLSADNQELEELSKVRAEAGSKGGKQKVANVANANFAKQDEANVANATNKNKNKEEDIKESTLKSTKEKRDRFSPPSVEEVAAYCKERGNKVNAQTFVDFYSAKGWKVGQNPMKDWKACVRTWEQRDNYGGTTPQRPRLLRAQDYKQREYSGKQLESVLGVDDIYAEGAS
jgi:hypothetical protein